jgi:hypothetical protein
MSQEIRLKAALEFAVNQRNDAQNISVNLAMQISDLQTVVADQKVVISKLEAKHECVTDDVPVAD